MLSGSAGSGARVAGAARRLVGALELSRRGRSVPRSPRSARSVRGRSVPERARSELRSRRSGPGRSRRSAVPRSPGGVGDRVHSALDFRAALPPRVPALPRAAAPRFPAEREGAAGRPVVDGRAGFAALAPVRGAPLERAPLRAVPADLPGAPPARAAAALRGPPLVRGAAPAALRGPPPRDGAAFRGPPSVGAPAALRGPPPLARGAAAAFRGPAPRPPPVAPEPRPRPL
jgi:hypothetical protein